jgi:hypothetical protein
MNSKKTFRLPEKKIPVIADLKIQFRLWKKHFFEQIRNINIFLKFVFAGFSAILIFISFTGYVYTSENIIRGDNLYSYKRDLEIYWLSNLNSSEKRAKYFLKIADRRIAEANTALRRDTGLNLLSFIPQVQASEFNIKEKLEKNIKEEINQFSTVEIQDSIASGLIVESAQALTFALDETNNIQDENTSNNVRNEVVAKIKNQNKKLGNMTSNLENETIQKVVNKIQLINKSNLSKDQKPILVRIDQENLSADNKNIIQNIDELDDYFDNEFEKELEATLEKASQEIEEKVEEAMEKLDTDLETMEKMLDKNFAEIDIEFEKQFEDLDEDIERVVDDALYQIEMNLERELEEMEKEIEKSIYEAEKEIEEAMDNLDKELEESNNLIEESIDDAMRQLEEDLEDI